MRHATPAHGMTLVAIMGVMLLLNSIALGVYTLAHLATLHAQNYAHYQRAQSKSHADLVASPEVDPLGEAALSTIGRTSVGRTLYLHSPETTPWSSSGWLDLSSLLAAATSCTAFCTLPAPAETARWSQFCCASVPKDGRMLGNLVTSSLTIPAGGSVAVSGSILARSLTAESDAVLVAGGLIHINELWALQPRVQIVVGSASSRVRIDRVMGSAEILLLSPFDPPLPFPLATLPTADREIVALIPSPPSLKSGVPR